MISMIKDKIRGFETISKKNLQVFKEETEVLLPLRGSKTAAGYDFYATKDLEIRPQEKIMFWTDVKAYMQAGEMLLLDIRSSVGTKQDLMIANVLPLIDSDYYNSPKNEGNIGICLRNLKPSIALEGYEEVIIADIKKLSIPKIKDLTKENTVQIKKGERVAQGFFVEFKESDNCNTENQRSGGFGSTNNK